MEKAPATPGGPEDLRVKKPRGPESANQLERGVPSPGALERQAPGEARGLQRPPNAFPSVPSINVLADPTGPAVPSPEILGADVPRAAALVPRLQLEASSPGLSDAGTDSVEQTARQLVESTVRRTIGRGKVERGLVHPYFGELGRALVARWQPDRAVTENGLSGFSGQLGRGLSGFAKAWKQQAESYGASGSPYGRESQLNPDDIPLVGNSDMQELARQRRLRAQLREQSRESRRALVRVVQDRSGRLVSVELLRPSRDRATDRTALEDVQASAQLLPVPPPEALGDRERLVSLWEFEMIVSITPPVPVVAFEFDLALKHFDARTPLDRRIYKRVRLVEIE
jgi:hypothetical protein